ncbi:MAG TPA: TIR domain-containing protein [Vicinamibacterales bacterium]|nr:TIR domain-containing protein [Vicinamibacterales bacterium]
MTMSEASPKSLERYFREPGLPNLLKPGMSGTACCNIRTALSSLGCQREWQNGEMYDAELQQVVRDFQVANDHPNADGCVGPGTRRLLVKRLLETDFDFSDLLEPLEYDVALSFAGEDRPHAEALAAILRQHQVRVFYDSTEQANLWGKNLVEHLHDVFSRRARFCVMFVSRAYAAKAWPTHERRAALERAFQESSRDYVLPVRIDRTLVPGLPSTVGYLSIETGIEEIGRLLREKLRTDREQRVTVWTDKHSNRFG